MSRPVYFIASYDITDPERYERDYVAGIVPTLMAAGAEVVVASSSATRLEGESGGQTIVIRFPSEESFRGWYDGGDYAPLKQLRFETTANGSAVLARGFVRHRPPGTA